MVNELSLELTSTARKYGYITWRSDQDHDVHSLLGAAEDAELILPNGNQSRKRIDWKNRRISVGYSLTRSLSPAAISIKLLKRPDGRLQVIFE